jgi:hypothetical protein
MMFLKSLILKNLMIKYFKFDYNNFIKVWSMFVFGFVMVFLRNMDPILSPIIYTEDGSWLGMALSFGWADAFLNAKEGYFVWGNLFLLWCAFEFSNLYAGHPLLVLPQAIAFTSYIFYASVATLAYFITRNILSSRVRFLLFFVVILIPLGESANENIGRISNVGYLAVFLSLLLVFEKAFRKTSEFKDGLLQLALIFQVMINPINMLIIPVLAYYANINDKFILRRSAIVKITIDYRYVFSFIVFSGLLQKLYFNGGAGTSITGKINLTSLVEVGIARSILYPLVFPIYSYFNDISTVLVFGVLILFLIYLYVGIPKDAKVRKMIDMSVISLLVFLFFTIYMRRSLTEQLGGYLTTFPDRYFVGLNVLSIFIFILISGSQSARPRFSNILRRMAIFTVFSIYFISSLKLFELNSPRMRIMTGGDFYESICLAETEGDGLVRIPTYFTGWNMTIPNSLRKSFVEIYDCKFSMKQLEKYFYITDQNWFNGIARDRAGFLIHNNEENRSQYTIGGIVIFINGENRKISSVTESGLYLHVWLEGSVLDPEKIGSPSNFKVIKDV